jgi:teichuronic acid biosynthesis glycosyltransferase TuaC
VTRYGARRVTSRGAGLVTGCGAVRMCILNVAIRARVWLPIFSVRLTPFNTHREPPRGIRLTPLNTHREPHSVRPIALNIPARPVTHKPVTQTLADPAAATLDGEPAGAEDVLDLASQSGAGADERDRGAEHALEHWADQRVVGAAEDHGVNAGGAQRGAGLADDAHGALVELLAGLNQRRQRRAGHGVQGDVGVDRVHGLLVGAAGDGRGRCQQADASGARGGDGTQRLGTHDAEYVHADRGLHHASLQRGQRGGGGGVAGDDEQLDPAAQQLVGDLGAEAREFPGGTLAVGKARGVAKVEKVLARKRDEQLVQNREAPDAGVEHADRSSAGVALAGGGPQISDARCGSAHYGGIIPERASVHGAVRALVVSNMLADGRHPERGRFVRDQVAALRGLPDVEVELYEFAPGAGGLARAARELRARYGVRAAGRGVDVVHAHYGLTAWPALAVRARLRGLTVHGTDVRHWRTREATRVVLGLMGLVGAASADLAGELPGGRARARAQVLPCGVDMNRFVPIARAQARARALPGAHAHAGARTRAHARSREWPQKKDTYVLFPADPARAGKRFDRARALIDAIPTERRPELLTLGGVPPEEVPFWVNAANAVIVPSEHEGFGLAVLEALACDVPVLATPTGVHAQALSGVRGALCAPFELATWRGALEPHLAAGDPRIEGRGHAEPFSATAMAARLAAAWRALLKEDSGHGG